MMTVTFRKNRNRKGQVVGFGRTRVDGKQIGSPDFAASSQRGVKQQIHDWEHGGGLKAKIAKLRAVAGGSGYTNGMYLKDWFKKQSPKWEVLTQGVNASNFENHVTSDAEFCAVPLEELALADVLRFIDGMVSRTIKNPDHDSKPKPATESTKHNICKLISPAYNRAVRLGKISVNPFNLLEKSEKPRASKSRIKGLTPEHEAQLIAYVDSEGSAFWRAYVHFCLDAGCGPAEAFGLQRGDINFKTHRVSIRRNVVTPRGSKSEERAEPL